MKKSVDFMIQRGIIESNERDIYLYGMECMLLKTVHFISYLLIAILLNETKNLLILWFVFGALRKNAGGYHAKTRINCYFFSCSIVFAFLLVSQLNITNEVRVVLLLASSIGIWVWSPVSSGNMELSDNEKSYFRRKTRKNLLLIVTIYIICINTKLVQFASVIVESCVLMTIILILGKVQNKHNIYR